MSLVDGNGGGLSAADVAAVMGSGNGTGWGADGAWWIIILVLFAMAGNWGNGFGGGGNMAPYVLGQSGFDQQAVMSALGGISNQLANAEVSRCNSQANILQTLNNNQAATMSGVNGLAMNLQNCCCENRAQVADVKYAIATESAATRAASQAGTQQVLDKLCQLEMDGMKQNYENRIAGLTEQLNNLRTQLNLTGLRESQSAQTAQIMADNAAQTVALEQYLNPTPVPAYTVPNPNCCSSVFGNRCGNVVA